MSQTGNRGNVRAARLFVGLFALSLLCAVGWFILNTEGLDTAATAVGWASVVSILTALALPAVLQIGADMTKRPRRLPK